MREECSTACVSNSTTTYMQCVTSVRQLSVEYLEPPIEGCFFLLLRRENNSSDNLSLMLIVQTNRENARLLRGEQILKEKGKKKEEMTSDNAVCSEIPLNATETGDKHRSMDVPSRPRRNCSFVLMIHSHLTTFLLHFFKPLLK